MTKLMAPRDENELMMVRSLLDGEGIAYHIHNEHFGGLYPGLNIFPFNERIILVDESDYDRAWALARDFIEAMEKKSSDSLPGISSIRPPDCSPQNTDTGA
jgi:hypothetical protein